MKRGVYEYLNLAVLCQEGEPLPSLSEEAIDMLSNARSCAEECNGYAILPAKAKIALLESYCLNRLRRNRDNGKPIDNSAAWELIDLLGRRVVDVYPFRDRQPD